MSTPFNALKVFHIKKNHKTQLHCKQGNTEHSLSGATVYKELFPISNKPTGALEDVINTPVRPRYQEHPSPLSINISEQHSCHLLHPNEWLDFEGAQRRTDGCHTETADKILHCPDMQSHQDGRLCRIMLISSVSYLTRKCRKCWHIPFKAAFILLEHLHSAVWNYFVVIFLISKLTLKLSTFTHKTLFAGSKALTQNFSREETVSFRPGWSFKLDLESLIEN